MGVLRAILGALSHRVSRSTPSHWPVELQEYRPKWFLISDATLIALPPRSPHPSVVLGVGRIVVGFIFRSHHAGFVISQHLEHHGENLGLFIGLVDVFARVLLDVEEARPRPFRAVGGVDWAWSTSDNGVLEQTWSVHGVLVSLVTQTRVPAIPSLRCLESKECNVSHLANGLSVHASGCLALRTRVS